MYKTVTSLEHMNMDCQLVIFTCYYIFLFFCDKPKSVWPCHTYEHASSGMQNITEQSSKQKTPTLLNAKQILANINVCRSRGESKTKFAVNIK